MTAGGLCLTLLLAGCTTRPDRAGDGLRFPFQSRYQAARDGTPVLLDNAAWWRGLNDPVLDTLIARALAQNLSLKVTRGAQVERREADGQVAAQQPGRRRVSHDSAAVLGNDTAGQI